MKMGLCSKGYTGEKVCDVVDQEFIIPDYIVETLARHLMPKVQEYFESKDGQEAFERWKEQRSQQSDKTD